MHGNYRQSAPPQTIKHESVSGIARDLKLSQKTVKKYLKAETEPAYQHNAVHLLSPEFPS